MFTIYINIIISTRIYPDSLEPQQVEKNGDTIKYLIEFNSYEKAKQAKEKLKSSFKNDQVRIESALYEVY